MWTAENHSNTLRMDAKIFVSAKKYLRKKKFPDRRGHGLRHGLTKIHTSEDYCGLFRGQLGKPLVVWVQSQVLFFILLGSDLLIDMRVRVGFWNKIFLKFDHRSQRCQPLAIRCRTTPPKKKAMRPPPIKSTSMPQTPNRLKASNGHLNLKREKRKKISEVFRRLPKLTQSWTEVFRRFSNVAQRIRKVSRVRQSILKTYRFLIYWLTEIQWDSLLYRREKEEGVYLVFFNIWFCG